MWGGRIYVMSKNTLKYKVRKQQSNMWTVKYNVKLGYKKVKCAVNGKGYHKVKCRWNAIFFVNYAAIQHNFGSTKNILQCGYAKLCFGWMQVNEVQNSTDRKKMFKEKAIFNTIWKRNPLSRVPPFLDDIRCFGNCL